jgi:hypothetical protein
MVMGIYPLYPTSHLYTIKYNIDLPPLHRPPIHYLLGRTKDEQTVAKELSIGLVLGLGLVSQDAGRRLRWAGVERLTEAVSVVQQMNHTT